MTTRLWPPRPRRGSTIKSIAAKAVLEEIKRRQAVAATSLFDKTRHPLSKREWDFFAKRCHPHQQAVLLDPCKKLALLCPRRTGKTTVSMFKAVITAREYPGSQIAYIVPSSKHHAKRLFWEPLFDMNQKLNLGYQFMVAENRVLAPNRTSIYLFGAKNKESPRILRGNGWPLAILDECKDFGAHFEELIVESVLPGLEDYDGTLMLEGTPGDVLDGIFYRITREDTPPEGWSVHKWNKSVNTFMPPEKRDLKVIEQTIYWPMGLTAKSPKFRREQLAEWCTDDNERAYLYDAARNGFDGTLPEAGEGYAAHKWHYVLGIDLGERDANAFVVGAFALTHPDLFVVYDYARPRMSIDEIAAEVKRLQKDYAPMVSIVADTGGYGRGVVTDLNLRHNLYIEPADKTGNKLGNIALMNADFLCGKIKAREDSETAKEWLRLTRKIRPTDQKVLISHSDRGDAALYMFKASLHYAAREQKPVAKEGSHEWYNQEEARAVAAAVRARGVNSAWDAISDGAEGVYDRHADAWG